MKPTIKKSTNKPRLVRLQGEMDQLKLIDAIMGKVLSPLREEKQEHANRIRELLLDEGIAPDLLQKVQQIEVDPDQGEIRYILKPEGPRLHPTPEEPAKQPTAKKKATKKPTRKR